MPWGVKERYAVACPFSPPTLALGPKGKHISIFLFGRYGCPGLWGWGGGQGDSDR